jgi:hypothetical protein
MAFTDFLFNGETPPTVDTGSNVGGQLPLWYSQYLQSLFNRSSAIGGEDFIPYGAPRIAQTDPMQEQARTRAGQTAEAWTPYMAEAGAATARGAAAFDPNQATQFQSPYMSGVTDEIARLGNTNFQENILPTLNDAFIGSGQFGSTRNMDMATRAARDTQREIMGQQSLSLQRGQEAAMKDYGTWTQRGLEGGQNLSALASLQQNLDARTAAGLETAGATRRGEEQAGLDLAYGDFQEQRDFPWQTAGRMSDILRGAHIPGISVGETRAEATPGPSPLAGLGALWGVMAQQNT